MKNIPIFRAEFSIDGLADKIQANCSVAYTVPLSIIPVASSHGQILKGMVEQQQDGLFFVKSVLVTTDWNKNDDVFVKPEVWAARHSARRKPTNVNHNEDYIVGHILDTWAVDNFGNTIPDDSVLDDVPDIFHLCTASVIYTVWEKPENQERADKLIAEIKQGQKFVSMECIFNNFDYAVMNSQGESFVVARNEESAFLTKHLRIYGGTGEFEGHRLGRILKNITFVGKGYVSNPANQNSVIFNDKPVFDLTQASHNNPFSKDSGVYSIANMNNKTQEIKNMSTELELLKSQVAKTETALEEANKARAEAERKLAEADIAKYESQIEQLQTDGAAKANENAALLAKNDELQSTINELTEQTKSLTKANEELTKELEVVRQEKLVASRVSVFVDGGFSREDATVKVEKFANLNDEQFEALAEELINALKSANTQSESQADANSNSVSDAETEEVSDEEQDETTASENELEEVETEGATAGAVSEETQEDNIEATRASLASFLASNYLHTELQEVNGG